MPHQLLKSPTEREFEPDLAVPPRTTWTVQAEKQISYEVRVTRDLLDVSNPALLTAGARPGRAEQRRFCVVDTTVNLLYGDRLREYLDRNAVAYRLHVVAADEVSKTMDTALRIVRELDEFGIDRRSEPILAVGGGVLLDVVGVVSSLYRRHTPYVRIPTTLIGLIDAGIGVKTGVNFGEHKNRLGSYEPPAVALLDRSFLSTLDHRHVSNGLAEILKIALIKDRRLFEVLEANGEDLLAERLQGTRPDTELAARQVLQRAVHGMLEELQPNLWEHELERLVDYGHSFSPTIEMQSLPALLHGEAVCVDMALTTTMGWRRGLLDAAERDRIIAVMRRLRLPVWSPACRPDVLEKALRDTVRHRDGMQRLPLPVGIGGATFVNDVTSDELAVAAADLAALGRTAVVR